jgi:hypothetical protein
MATSYIKYWGFSGSFNISYMQPLAGINIDQPDKQ